MQQPLTLPDVGRDIALPPYQMDRGSASVWSRWPPEGRRTPAVKVPGSATGFAKTPLFGYRFHVRAQLSANARFLGVPAIRDQLVPPGAAYFDVKLCGEKMAPGGEASPPHLSRA
ncbi:hypothetical protein Zmor_016801 [Zophobas morio]|uniref:Uncharacterized protein n=1 Tax=Zophobas morio TaxID=2755281 RepID=A0AA38I8A1_9CUCU|nr:hypothetical protein Zmor_016801 [Zophobas morio]